MQFHGISAPDFCVPYAIFLHKARYAPDAVYNGNTILTKYRGVHCRIFLRNPLHPRQTSQRLPTDLGRRPILNPHSGGMEPFNEPCHNVYFKNIQKYYIVTK
jgi:hypothetical protein